MACSKANPENPMTKLTRQDAIKDLSHGDCQYCCYCTEPKTYGSCCGENHFVPFEDLYEEDKEAMIEEYLTQGNSNGT
jgi:hypothetical protein